MNDSKLCLQALIETWHCVLKIAITLYMPIICSGHTSLITSHSLETYQTSRHPGVLQRLSRASRAGNDNVISEMTAASWRSAFAHYTADNKQAQPLNMTRLVFVEESATHRS